MQEEVDENKSLHRFELPLADGVVAAAYYRLEGGNIVLFHTDVPGEFTGLGIGTRLAKGTFDLLRASRRKAVLRCPFMSSFFANHLDYLDVIAG